MPGAAAFSASPAAAITPEAALRDPRVARQVELELAKPALRKLPPADRDAARRRLATALARALHAKDRAPAAKTGSPHTDTTRAMDGVFADLRAREAAFTGTEAAPPFSLSGAETDAEVAKLVGNRADEATSFDILASNTHSLFERVREVHRRVFRARHSDAGSAFPVVAGH